VLDVDSFSSMSANTIVLYAGLGLDF
jgi:hypothetical protein